MGCTAHSGTGVTPAAHASTVSSPNSSPSGGYRCRRRASVPAQSVPTVTSRPISSRIWGGISGVFVVWLIASSFESVRRGRTWGRVGRLLKVEAFEADGQELRAQAGAVIVVHHPGCDQRSLWDHSRATRIVGCWTRAGRTLCAACIPTSPCSPSGTTSATAGTATPGSAWTTCSSVQTCPSASSAREWTAGFGARTMRAITLPPGSSCAEARARAGAVP